MMILDEVPMITSMNVKMEDDIVFITLLKHGLAFDTKNQIKSIPTFNGLNLTSQEYVQFI